MDQIIAEDQHEKQVNPNEQKSLTEKQSNLIELAMLKLKRFLDYGKDPKSTVKDLVEARNYLTIAIKDLRAELDDDLTI